MIRVHKNQEEIPSGLASKKNYRHATVLAELKKIYHGEKCAYCETPANPGYVVQVDHYRPKSIYPWLEFEWTNLLFCCQLCNLKKSNHFPLQGQKVDQEQPDPVEWSGVPIRTVFWLNRPC